MTAGAQVARAAGEPPRDPRAQPRADEADDEIEKGSAEIHGGFAVRRPATLPDAMTRPLEIRFAGGMPPALGGGGMELQMQRTAEALGRLGHRVARIEAEEAGARFDVLHAFHAEAWLTQVLPHWKRNRTPLVVSPVLTIRPGVEQRTMRLARRIPGLRTSARQRADVLRAADAIVALTEFERDMLVADLGASRRPGPRDRKRRDAARLSDLPGLPEGVPDAPFALMLGNVSSRKRQAEVLAAAAGSLPFVVAGGFEGSEAERAAWLDVVSRHGATWLGEVGDRGGRAGTRGGRDRARALQRGRGPEPRAARVPGGGHAGGRERHPRPPGAGGALPRARARRGRGRRDRRPARAAALAPGACPAPVPTWDDVARDLDAVYATVASGPGPGSSSTSATSMLDTER